MSAETTPGVSRRVRSISSASLMMSGCSARPLDEVEALRLVHAFLVPFAFYWTGRGGDLSVERRQGGMRPLQIGHSRRCGRAVAF
ncbi:hypothetical protein AC629_28365 [Bradyrhizobium sp. NAS80.1]|nr:hypothetical protein AC629_28365 [Bradyrhizobium sp. NAS80.1]